MKLYTMGFTQKTAECFFGLIREYDISMLVDIRLNNRSQLAGFTKGDDLQYFLRELCHCAYSHRQDFAPTKELLDDYKKGRISWDDYVSRYIPMMDSNHAVDNFMHDFGEYEHVLLLCSEPTPEHCHRRLLAEMITGIYSEIELMHI